MAIYMLLCRIAFFILKVFLLSDGLIENENTNFPIGELIQNQEGILQNNPRREVLIELMPKMLARMSLIMTEQGEGGNIFATETAGILLDRLTPASEQKLYQAVKTGITADMQFQEFVPTEELPDPRIRDEFDLVKPVVYKIFSQIEQDDPDFGPIMLSQIKKSSSEYIESQQDALSGLLSKDAFNNDCNNWQQDSIRVGILFMDLDDLKTINDTQGHHIGDQAIRQIGMDFTETKAQMISEIEAQIISINDNNNPQIADLKKQRRILLDSKFYRYGGDEFILAVPQGTDSICREIKYKFIADMARRNLALESVNGRLPLKVSIGYAGYDNLFLKEKHQGKPSDIENIKNQADEIMYCVKFINKVTNERSSSLSRGDDGRRHETRNLSRSDTILNNIGNELKRRGVLNETEELLADDPIFQEYLCGISFKNIQYIPEQYKSSVAKWAFMLRNLGKFRSIPTPNSTSSPTESSENSNFENQFLTGLMINLLDEHLNREDTRLPIIADLSKILTEPEMQKKVDGFLDTVGTEI